MCIRDSFKGAFPFWLAPVQVALLTVADRHIETAEKLREKLFNKGIRVKIDDRNEKIGYKIREWSMEKVPYILVLGDAEATLDKINVRKRGGEQGTYDINDFIEKIDKENSGGVYF